MCIRKEVTNAVSLQAVLHPRVIRALREPQTFRADADVGIKDVDGGRDLRFDGRLSTDVREKRVCGGARDQFQLASLMKFRERRQDVSRVGLKELNHLLETPLIFLGQTVAGGIVCRTRLFGLAQRNQFRHVPAISVLE